MPAVPPAVGISACLLGERVRYDGSDRREGAFVERFGPYVRWVAVCPEVEAGLGVPREPIRLEEGRDGGCVRGVTTGREVTPLLERWAADRVARLRGEDLCGFVLKARSPSCGWQGVPIHDGRGRPVGAGRGRFARAVAEAWPDLPVIEEDALRDAWGLEAFATAVFTCQRWREAGCEADPDRQLPLFHARHRCLLASRDPGAPARLARWVGDPSRSRAHRYRSDLMDVLRRPATREDHARVLAELTAALRARSAAPLPLPASTPASLPAAFAAVRALARHVDPGGVGLDAWLEPYPPGLRLLEDVVAREGTP